MKPQSVKRRRANVTVTLTHPPGVPVDRAALIEEYETRKRRSPAPSPFVKGGTENLPDGFETDSAEAALRSYPRRRKSDKGKGKETFETIVHEDDRPSQQDGTEEPPNDSELVAVAEDLASQQDLSLLKSKHSRKSKAKSKDAMRNDSPEKATSAVGSPLLDSANEPPPSAQLTGRRDRRESESRAQRLRKRRWSGNEESVGWLKTEPSDNHSVSMLEPDHNSNMPAPESSNGTDEEVHSRAEERSSDEHAVQPPSAPLVSSLGSAGSRRSLKRKTKLPYFSREAEQNAEAFAELANDDVVVSTPPRPTRRARAPTSAVSRKAKRQNQANQKQGAHTGAEESDHGDPGGESQYRSGPLLKMEQNKILRAIERFRESEGMTQQELTQLIHENPQTNAQGVHRQFWSSIQDACPTRRRRKLIEWCRQNFHNFAGRGVWTKEQDDELAELFEVHGKKWSVIGGLINRHQRDVRDRWRNYLVCRDNVKTDAWSDGEEGRLRDLVEASIERIRDQLEESSGKSPEELINWLTISEAMGHTRSRLQCMEKWKRMRADEPIPAKVPTVLPSGSSWRLDKARKDLRKLTSYDKYDLMCAIRDSGVRKDSTIRWKEIVAGTFDGKYERQTLVVTWGRLRQAVPNWESKTTRECAEYLCDMYEKEGNFGSLGGNDPAAESEHDVAGEIVTPATKKRSKGKRVVSSAVAASSGSDTDQPAGPEPRKESAARKRRDRGEIRGSDEPLQKRRKGHGSATHSAKNTPDDTVMDDQASPELRSSSSVKKRPRSAVRESSPELGTNATESQEPRQIDRISPEVGVQASQLSPTVDPQEARKKRREEGRASIVPNGNANHGEEEAPPKLKPTPTKATKRPRRDSFSIGDVASPNLKKQRASGSLEVNGIQASKRGSQKTKTSARSWSEMSSDMDDMEDIPATLPVSSQAAR